MGIFGKGGFGGFLDATFGANGKPGSLDLGAILNGFQSASSLVGGQPLGIPQLPQMQLRSREEEERRRRGITPPMLPPPVDAFRAHEFGHNPYGMKGY